MLTALNIEDYTRRGAGRIFSLLRRNRIRVEHRYCDAVAVKSIVYERRRERMSWTAIDRFLKDRRTQLLCPPELTLPAGSGLKRFVSGELNRRLCENAALWLLRELRGERPSVVLVDSTGDRAQLCACLLDYTDRVRVITDSPRVYLNEADRLLEEKGAALRVSSGSARITDAQIIIAPDRLTRPLGCDPGALIFSGEAPAHPQPAPVIDEYLIDLPEKYRSLCPDYLEPMYFASALYTLAGAHELGSTVFTRCCDGRVLHTRMSLIKQLKAHFDSPDGA